MNKRNFILAKYDRQFNNECVDLKRESWLQPYCSKTDTFPSVIYLIKSNKKKTIWSMEYNLKLSVLHFYFSD